MRNIFKTVSILALSAVLCFASATYVKAESADDYVYSVQDQGEEAVQDQGEQNGYVYQQGQQSNPPEEEKTAEKDEGGESLQDLAMQLLNDNKVNIAILMILLAALGVVLYKNDKLTTNRKR